MFEWYCMDKTILISNKAHFIIHKVKYRLNINMLIKTDTFTGKNAEKILSISQKNWIFVLKMRIFYSNLLKFSKFGWKIPILRTKIRLFWEMDKIFSVFFTVLYLQFQYLIDKIIIKLSTLRLDNDIK